MQEEAWLLYICIKNYNMQAGSGKYTDNVTTISYLDDKKPLLKCDCLWRHKVQKFMNLKVNT